MNTTRWCTIVSNRMWVDLLCYMHAVWLDHGYVAAKKVKNVGFFVLPEALGQMECRYISGICLCPCERTINPYILKALCFEDQAARLCLGTYLDLDLERDLDSERFEAREGLPDPERLSDLMLAGLPRSDLEGERDSWSHTRMLKQLTVNMAPDNKKQVFCFVNILLLQCICKCCGERC